MKRFMNFIFNILHNLVTREVQDEGALENTTSSLSFSSLQVSFELFPALM